MRYSWNKGATMGKASYESIQKWRKNNKDKVKEYNKRYLENVKKKAIEEYKKELENDL